MRPVQAGQIGHDGRKPLPGRPRSRWCGRHRLRPAGRLGRLQVWLVGRRGRRRRGGRRGGWRRGPDGQRQGRHVTVLGTLRWDGGGRPGRPPTRRRCESRCPGGGSGSRRGWFGEQIQQVGTPRVPTRRRRPTPGFAGGRVGGLPGGDGGTGLADGLVDEEIGHAFVDPHPPQPGERPFGGGATSPAFQPHPQQPGIRPGPTQVPFPDVQPRIGEHRHDRLRQQPQPPVGDRAQHPHIRWHVVGGLPVGEEAGPARAKRLHQHRPGALGQPVFRDPRRLQAGPAGGPDRVRVRGAELPQLGQAAQPQRPAGRDRTNPAGGGGVEPGFTGRGRVPGSGGRDVGLGEFGGQPPQDESPETSVHALPPPSQDAPDHRAVCGADIARQAGRCPYQALRLGAPLPPDSRAGCHRVQRPDTSDDRRRPRKPTTSVVGQGPWWGRRPGIVVGPWQAAFVRYRSTRKSVYPAKYHVIWCPKYRRRVLGGRVEARLKQLIGEVVAESGGQVIELETMPDHVHLLMEVPPTVPLSGPGAEVEGPHITPAARRVPASTPAAGVVVTVVVRLHGGWGAAGGGPPLRRKPETGRVAMSYRYRAYPTADQVEGFARHCQHARYVWNLACEQQSWYVRDGARTARPPIVGAADAPARRGPCRVRRGWPPAPPACSSRRCATTTGRWPGFSPGSHRQPSWRKAGRDEGFAVRDVHVRRLSRRRAEVLVPKVGMAAVPAVPAAAGHDRDGPGHAATGPGAGM